LAFKDHFSGRPADYRRYRPVYPQALIDYVSAEAPHRRLAVDCATGSGQAALALAAGFQQVVALDGSLRQLASAGRAPGVRYVAALAECIPLKDSVASLIVAAQAVHWFDFDRFYAECRRVLERGGVFAAWTYALFRVDPAVDRIIDRFYCQVVGDYWPPERRHVEQGYRSLPFPWDEIPTPAFALDEDWDLDRVIGYLGTWSAVQRFLQARAEDPLPRLRQQLAAHWPEQGTRHLHWPIHLRLGRSR
jgi:SAM-dependent methyltransferase